MEKRQRILLIHGNDERRAGLQGRLEAEGFDVTAAGSGQERQEAFSGPPEDLVVLDMALPRMEGIERYQALRANPRTRRIPVILMTERAVDDYWEPLSSDTDGPCFVAATSGDLSLLLARITQLLAQALVGV